MTARLRPTCRYHGVMDVDLQLVLPPEAAPTAEPQSFGVAFPGLWVAGVPQPVSELGLTAEEALALVARHHLPLVDARAQEPARAPRRRRGAQDDGDLEGEPGNGGERGPEASEPGAAEPEPES